MFIQSFVSDFRHTGTLAASSRYLSDSVGRLAHQANARDILEVGVGTGAITDGLLRRIDGLASGERRLVLVERSPRFCHHLREKYGPAVALLLNADICDLDPALLPGRPNLIVSSVPLFSLTWRKRARIVRKYRQLLAPGGLWIQYTYNPSTRYFAELRDFALVHQELVLRNFPPARIVVLHKQAPARTAGNALGNMFGATSAAMLSQAARTAVPSASPPRRFPQGAARSVAKGIRHSAAVR